MTDMTMGSGPAAQDEGISAKVQRTLGRRYAAERRFKLYGLTAIGLALAFLAFLFFDIVSKGITAFWQTQVQIEVTFDPAKVDPLGDGSEASLLQGDFRGVSNEAFRSLFPNVTKRKEKKALRALLSEGAQYDLRDMLAEDPSLLGQTASVWVSLSDDADVFAKGRITDIRRRDGAGTITFSATEGTVGINSSVADFVEIVDAVNTHLQESAKTLQRENDGLDRRIELLERNLANGVGDLASAEEDLAAAHQTIEANDTKIAELLERAAAPEGDKLLSPEMPSFLIAVNGGIVKVTSVRADALTGTALVPLNSDQQALSGSWEILELTIPEANRRKLQDQEASWLLTLEAQEIMSLNFNTTLFTSGDSREPEQAGIWGAVVGSFFTLIVTLLLSFPIGVMTAVYLEEFAPKNRITDFVEVNINNLAAVPSIVFGLLGLAVFLNFFGLPRSAPVVGGMVLTLMTLPTIIIASRAALKAVPPSIREAALGMGASRLQAMTHHTLPLAMPGMLTGTIIGMAQALGETAPLLMIGMVAFIADIPGGPTDPSTVLPVQIYLWADSPERAFVERTSAAIMVLLGFLISMNLLAVVLRKRFERRW